VGEHGQGGITRRTDGRLQVSITMPNGSRVTRYVGKDRDGKRQRRAAEAVLRELIDARERELYPSAQTLGDYLRSWIEGLPDGRKPPRPRTIEHYRYVVERYLVPTLGHLRLDRLSPRVVQAWVDGDRSRSATHHFAVLRRALNVARRQQMIADSPALFVEPPRRETFKGSPLTREEALRLLAVLGRLSPLWRLALDSGLRESELLGLSWDDLDLDAGTLTLRVQLYRDREGWQLVEPKTKRDDPINLAPSTVRALREHRQRMAEERTPEWRYYGLVFVTTKGDPIARSDVLRAFKVACVEAGIPPRRFHDLRGTSLTFLEEEGVSEAVRMRRAGHVTTRMARHYAQARDLDREAARAIERVIG